MGRRNSSNFFAYFPTVYYVQQDLWKNEKKLQYPPFKDFIRTGNGESLNKTPNKPPLYQPIQIPKQHIWSTDILKRHPSGSYMSLMHLWDKSMVIVVLTAVPVAKRGGKPARGCCQSAAVGPQVPFAWEGKIRGYLKQFSRTCQYGGRCSLGEQGAGGGWQDLWVIRWVVGFTWGRVRMFVGKPQGDPAWIVWCCVPGTMTMKMEMGFSLVSAKNFKTLRIDWWWPWLPKHVLIVDELVCPVVSFL